MTLRPYLPDSDFDIIRTWIMDRREHALWCADRVAYPLTREGFDGLLDDEAARFGNKAYIAGINDKAVGFFCISMIGGTKEAMLKFVLVDRAERGKGIGRELIRLAAKTAFDDLCVDALRLCVFSANHSARACYEHSGFTETNITPGAFLYNSESWDRCEMKIKRQR